MRVTDSYWQLYTVNVSYRQLLADNESYWQLLTVDYGASAVERLLNDCLNDTCLRPGHPLWLQNYRQCVPLTRNADAHRGSTKWCTYFVVFSQLQPSFRVFLLLRKFQSFYFYPSYSWRPTYGCGEGGMVTGGLQVVHNCMKRPSLKPATMSLRLSVMSPISHCHARVPSPCLDTAVLAGWTRLDWTGELW